MLFATVDVSHMQTTLFFSAVYRKSPLGFQATPQMTELHVQLFSILKTRLILGFYLCSAIALSNLPVLVFQMCREPSKT